MRCQRAATTVALESLTGRRSLERSKELIKAAGYNGEPFRLLTGTDIHTIAAIGAVAADLCRRLGLNLDIASSDMATVLRRRSSQETLEHGGWSVFLTTTSGLDLADPGSHYAIRGNGTAAWPGWPRIPKLEQLRDAWLAAPDEPSRKTICADIQRVAMDEVPYIPLGFYTQNMAMRRNLRGSVAGFPIFWNIERV